MIVYYKIITVFLFVLTFSCCKSDTKHIHSKESIVDKPLVLHFTETTGWDHKTRIVSQKMFSELSFQLRFDVLHSNDSEIFDDVDVIKEVDLIVFSNTTGDDLLTKEQRGNFEKCILNGAHFIGIHSASDTHRNNWKFYNDLVGAVLQIEPWHTESNFIGTMNHITDHPILDDIPNPWIKEGEYYYWDLNGGYIDTNSINTLLDVERTGPELYDRERPIAWYQDLPNGTKSFYTSLGHASWNYEDDKNEFRKLISNGILWMLQEKLDQKN